MFKKIFLSIITYIIAVMIFNTVAFGVPTNSSLGEIGEINVDFELNPTTNESYVGLSASRNNTIKIYAQSESTKGTLSYAEPEVGKITGGGLDKKIKVSSEQNYFTYISPEYIDIEDTNKMVLKNNMYALAVDLKFIFESSDGSSFPIYKTVYLYLPPTGLVYSSVFEPNGLDYLDEKLTDKRFKTFSIDLSLQNPEHDSVNIHDTLNKNLESYSNNNIKASKVNLITHSLCGLSVRKYIAQAKFYKGNISKLIMLACPNKGINPNYSGLYSSSLDSTQSQIIDNYLTTGEYIENLLTYIDPDIQYANIYSNSYIGTDGLVPEESAIFSKIYSKKIEDRTHFIGFSHIGSPITTDPLVEAQVYSWLMFDIPKSNEDSYSFEFSKIQGNVEVTDDKTLSSYLADTKDKRKINKYDIIETSSDSNARITIAKNNRVLGYIDLAQNTTLYFQNTSNNLVSLYISKGNVHFFTYENETTFYKILNTLDNKYIYIKGNGDFAYSIDTFNKIYNHSGSVSLNTTSNLQHINYEKVNKESTKLINSSLNILDSVYHDKWWDNLYPKYQMEVFQTGYYYVDSVINYLFNRIPKRIYDFENSYLNIWFGIIILGFLFIIIIGILKLINYYIDFSYIVPYEKINSFSEKTKKGISQKSKHYGKLLKSNMELAFSNLKNKISDKMKK